MKYGKHWTISPAKKEEYINKLLPQLPSLRAMAGLSQDELSSLVGISRQTYCLTESGSRGMSWNTYLSVIMFFDYNMRTHDLIRSMGVYPEDLFYHFNPGEEKVKKESTFETAPELQVMFDSLDRYGRNTVVATMVSEYARCDGLTKPEVVKLMSGLQS